MNEEDTYIVDVEICLHKKIQSTRDVLLDLGPDGNMRPPGIAHCPLGTGKVRGDPGLNDRPVDPMIGTLGQTSLETTLGGYDEVGNLGSGASRCVWIGLLHVVKPLRWHLHHRHRVLRRCLRRYHCSGILAPGRRGLWGEGRLHRWRRLCHHRCGSTLVPDPRSLRDGGLYLSVPGEALRGIPASPSGENDKSAGARESNKQMRK